MIAHVLRHVLHEDLGAFARVLREDGWTTDYREVPVAGVDHQAVLACDLLVVLGGPCGAHEGEQYPWLAPEIAAIGERLRAGRPTLGICLGAQLMATALGARVYPGTAGAEIGWGAVELSAAGRGGPLAALEKVPLLHWHGDTFDLPERATLLASTAAYPDQAFAIGDHALGLQFHPEVDGAGIEHWLIGQAGAVDVARLRHDARTHGPAAGRAGSRMLRAWTARAFATA